MCENTFCPIPCQLCGRLCSRDHLHGLSLGESHLCGYARFFLSSTITFTWSTSEEHPCSALCSAYGICQVDTTPVSIEAAFTEGHETVQYTKVSAYLWRRLPRYLRWNQLTQSALSSTLYRPASYTNVPVALAAKRLICVKRIEPGALEHDGPHIHSNEEQPLHFCDIR